MISSPAILIVFLISAIIGVVGWTTVTYMVPGYGEIERSILGDEIYNQEFED